jgi:predicted RNase H-like nuclease (RuvC/YqgF family)
MSETTGANGPIEDFEADVFRALDRYFEARIREVAGNPKRVGPAVEAYEEARRQLAEAEEELERIRHRTEELKAGTVDAVVGSNEASELGEEISDLQEEVRDLAQAEKTAQRLKEDAEETLRRAELQFEGDLGLAVDEVAALALSKVEEIDAFKARLDQRFAEGRMSILWATA